MSHEGRRLELRAKMQQLIETSLKHSQAAGVAAALVVTVASLAATQAIAQDQWSPVPSPCDFVTSGGFVVTDSGKKANFGVHGGCKNGEFWGHVNYMDHTTGYSIDSIAVTGYLTPSPASHTRDICGMATTNRDEPQPVWFRVRLTDNGEPGIGDEFGMRLSNGYVVTTRALNTGRAGGGNVQMHDPNPSTIGPSPAPDEAMMCNGVPDPSFVGSPE